jgi:hypothetical protein
MGKTMLGLFRHMRCCNFHMTMDSKDRDIRMSVFKELVFCAVKLVNDQFQKRELFKAY